MLFLKKLLRRLLEKLRDAISVPQQPSMAIPIKEETLQSELRRVLRKLINKIDVSEKPRPKIFGNDSVGMIDGIKAYWRSLSTRWQIFLAGTMPVLFVYCFLYLTMVTPPELSPEEIFRHQKGRPLVRFVYVKEWPSSYAITSLLASILKTTLNTDVSLKSISQNDLTQMWSMMVNNGADITASVWLPRTHKNFKEDAAGDVVDLGAWMSGGRMGLIVPDYVKVDSIADLVASDFDSVIYGIDPDSTLNQRSHRAIDYYGLTGFRVDERNDRQMVKALEEAIKQKHNIVVAGWLPHWIFGEWKLKMLSDPLNVFGESESVHIFAAEDFVDNFPELSGFFTRVKLSPQQISEVMASIRRTKSGGLASTRWSETHSSLVLKWITGKDVDASSSEEK